MISGKKLHYVDLDRSNTDGPHVTDPIRAEKRFGASPPCRNRIGSPWMAWEHYDDKLATSTKARPLRFGVNLPRAGQ